MSTPLPLTFRASPLVPNRAYTPQEFLDAIVARLSIDTQEQLALFISGSTSPVTNVGPWLKNGVTWYVWDASTGSYIPEILESRSLRYIAGTATPDPAMYTFWIVLDGTGKAQEIRYFSGGAWKSVYDDSFNAIQAQIDTLRFDQMEYPFRGDSAGDQTLTLPVDQATVIFNETFDPNGVFATSTFTAPHNGYYQINAKVNMELGSGTPTGNAILVGLQKNGFQLPNEIVFDPIDDALLGSRTYSMSTILQLIAGDNIQLLVQASGTGAGTWLIKGNNTFMSGNRVITA